MEWIKCSDRMPISIAEAEEADFLFLEVIVTDGEMVGTCDCQSGFMPRPWVEFSRYGDISPEKITHWMPMPAPPTE